MESQVVTKMDAKEGFNGHEIMGWMGLERIKVG